MKAWNVSEVEWIVEARCWVLRDRASPGNRVDRFFWVTCYTDGVLADRCRCGGVAGAGSHQTPGGDASEGGFSLDEVLSEGSGDDGSVCLPVF
jgi:hypothetical protein